MLAAIMQQNQALQATIAQLMGHANQHAGTPRLLAEWLLVQCPLGQGQLSSQNPAHMVYATAPQGHQSMPQHPYHSQYAGAASNPQAEQHHSAVRPSPPSAVRDQGHRGGDSNAHHHINQRFKAKESKYSGSDEEVLQDFIDAYMATAEDYRLSAADKLQLFHNLFRGDALRFYYAHVKGRYRHFC